MASTFEQVRKAEDLMKSNENCVVVLIIDSTRHNHWCISSISRWLSGNGCLEDNYAVVETGPFDVYKLRSSLDDGREWISKNSLRRLDGCRVKVVWVVDNSLSGTFAVSSAVGFVNNVFEKQMQSVVIVAIDNNSDGLKIAKESYKVIHVASSEIETSVTHCVSTIRSLPSSVITVRSADLEAADKLETWDSEKIILFGKTGSGKSTIAQMLTSGKVCSVSKFKSGSDAKGVTKEVVRGQGRGWHVTDTPGFGETKEGTVPTGEATQKIATFIRKTCGVYSHFVYVFKWSRVDVYDTRLWHFFQQVFSKAEDNFTIIVTGREKDLSPEEKAELSNRFKGCESFVSVDFLSTNKNPKVEEEENVEIRSESLGKLEKELASLGRQDKVCREGRLSTERFAYIKGQGKSEMQFLGSFADPAAGVFHHLLVKPTILAKGMARTSKIDENFMLLPQ